MGKGRSNHGDEGCHHEHNVHRVGNEEEEDRDVRAMNICPCMFGRSGH